MLTAHGASRQIGITDVRFGSLADIAESLTDVCLPSKADICGAAIAISRYCR
jgi:hypothetical protein